MDGKSGEAKRAAPSDCSAANLTSIGFSLSRSTVIRDSRSAGLPAATGLASFRADITRVEGLAFLVERADLADFRAAVFLVFFLAICHLLARDIRTQRRRNRIPKWQVHLP